MVQKLQRMLKLTTDKQTSKQIDRQIDKNNIYASYHSIQEHENLIKEMNFASLLNRDKTKRQKRRKAHVVLKGTSSIPRFIYVPKMQNA